MLMFGTYRTALALIVVFHHIDRNLHLGTTAVMAFFALSGFLMTMLMDTTYKGRRWDFAVNRFLRLYPTYWATMAFMAALVLLHIKLYHHVGIPEGLTLVRHLLYVTNWQESPVLIVTSWAVTNEIVFYSLICFGISANRQRSLVWLAASILIALLPMFFAPAKMYINYFSPLLASLPFAAGSVAYFNRDRFALDRPAIAIAVLSAALFLTAIAQSTYGLDAIRFASVPFAAALAATLFHCKASRWDEAIGRLSYPIYLNHFGAGMVMLALSKYFFRSYPPAEYQALIACLFAIVIGSITVLFVDLPIDRLRTRIRASGVRSGLAVQQARRRRFWRSSHFRAEYKGKRSPPISALTSERG
jgi:peptidoglycan/LPS O-acetylase OafA/YrhL